MYITITITINFIEFKINLDNKQHILSSNSDQQDKDSCSCRPRALRQMHSAAAADNSRAPPTIFDGRRAADNL